MAHWQLGEKDKAREWHDRAAQWMDKHQPTDEELLRFRAEAAELLGIEKMKDFLLGLGGTRTVFAVDALSSITFNRQTTVAGPLSPVPVSLSMVGAVPGAAGAGDRV